MKFPRNAKVLRGHLDVTPFAGVFFCLLIFVLLGSLVYTPGVQINLPESSAPLPGVDGPRLSVAVDASGRFIFENQIIQGTNLLQRLQTEVARQTEPLTLVVLADKDVTVEKLGRLRVLAAQAGIKKIQEAVLPRAFDTPSNSRVP
jgi:biopolymer transport protein ExbD